MIEKRQLREQIRQQLAGLDAGTVRAHSATIWERLAGVDEFKAAKCLGVYVSVGSEIETHGLIRQLLAIGRQICVPAFVGKYVPAVILDFDQDLVAGQYGIPEPKPGAPVGAPDVWLVPGLAYDRPGNRLGRGRGFFDTLLRESRGTKIALAHEFQVQLKVPAEPHDVRVDYIVTEKQIINCGGFQ